jgi:uncharacterized protein YqiB (DUF1249 family)
MPHKRYSINLPAHMAECDANYVRLLKLFPDLRTEDGRDLAVELGDEAVRIELTVLERAPYTTLIQLAQREIRASSWLKQPQITIRLYHDASCAEVVAYQHARDFKAVYDYPNPSMHQPDEKTQVNRLLSELLAVCLNHGQIVELPLALSDS